MAVDKAAQSSDNNNGGKGDPNHTGPQAKQLVDPIAGPVDPERKGPCFGQDPLNYEGVW